MDYAEIMAVLCEQCGHANSPQFLFCSMCGERLRSVSWQEIPSPAHSLDRNDVPSAQTQEGDPAPPAFYLLEDDGPRPGQLRLYLALSLALLTLALMFGGRQQQLRAWLASHFAGHSAVRPAVTATSPPPPHKADPNQSAPMPETPRHSPGILPADSAIVDNGKTSPAQPTPSLALNPVAPQPPPAVAPGQYLAAQGERYLYGRGALQDCSLAMKDLAAAAAMHNSHAETLLGTMFATGHCASRNLPMAYNAFSGALKNDPNNRQLEQDLNMIWRQMTPVEKQGVSPR